jgi:UDP-perosamine 4-acetyltransferase
MKKILLIGGGGHAANIIDLLLNEQDTFTPIGYLDKKKGNPILGVPWIGDDQCIKEIKSNGVNYAFPAIGFGKNTNNKLRCLIYENLKSENFIIPNLISKYSIVRSEVNFGEGILIQAGSIIDTKSKIDNNVAIGFNVLVSHDAHIMNHAFLSGNVTLNGGVKIGEGSFLGMGSILYKNCGAWSKVAPGTVCMKEIPNKKIAFGDPIKFFPNVQN